MPTCVCQKNGGVHKQYAPAVPCGPPGKQGVFAIRSHSWMKLHSRRRKRKKEKKEEGKERLEKWSGARYTFPGTFKAANYDQPQTRLSPGEGGGGGKKGGGEGPCQPKLYFHNCQTKKKKKYKPQSRPVGQELGSNPGDWKKGEGKGGRGREQGDPDNTLLPHGAPRLNEGAIAVSSRRS